MRYATLITVLCTVLCLSVMENVYAHKVTVFAWVEGNTVKGEAKFSGGKRPKHAVVTAYDKNGETLFKGETDDNGAFSFIPETPGEMRIVLNAGTGHMGEWLLRDKDFGITEKTAAPKTPLVESNVPETDKANMSREEIVLLIETSLDKKLAPIAAQLAQINRTQAEKGPGFRDVIGGIGFIFGIFGTAAYMQSRRRK